MNFGEMPLRAKKFFTTLGAGATAMMIAGAAMAQEAAEAVAEAATEGAEAAAPAATGYTPLGPDMIKGQPIPDGLDLQPQFSEIGNMAMGLHIGLVWIMGIISALVLLLLLYVMVRFNKRANPVPSKTSHNTVIEVIWTLVPVLILVGIAVPSISLIAKQYEPAPKDALTVKVTGYQWYWGYSYPDNGEIEVISNMLLEEDAIAGGFPAQLEVDNRMVVPVGVPIRLQITAADVIHSFAVPSLWFKLDAVPGRLNEKVLKITEPGIYYGQCSELCGIKHGYMPIAVEAVPMEQFEAWVLSQGGTIGSEEAAPAAEATEAAADAAPAEDATEAAAAAPAA
jgi:cytochrome c oxidase subunit 2